MPTPTYTLIQAVTVGAGGASSIDFTSIPSTYTDLCLMISNRTTRATYNDYLKIGFNGTTTNITYRSLEGNGASASSFTESAAAQFIGEANADTSTSNTFDSFQIYLPNYAGSNNKSYSVDSVTENNVSGTNSAFANLTAGLWSSSSAITSIKQYSTAYLYGIVNS